MKSGDENGAEAWAAMDQEAIFTKAAAAINERYKPGTLAYIEARRPELAARLDAAMDRVNQEWAAGPAAGPGFKRALRTWYDLNLEAIDAFKGAE